MATTKRTIDVELSTSGLDSQGRPRRVPLAVDEAGNTVAVAEPPEMEPGLDGEHMLINIGPQHPATHGVLRLVLELDGETVVRCIPHAGYLHCGFEKIGEYRQYNQIIPWTDREDYLNSPGNNVAFALGAERLFGIEITDRCKVLRVMACELSRIMSHLVWLGTTCIDIGPFTPFLWAFQQREKIYEMLEAWIGARLTTSLTRVGGMGADIPDNWIEQLTAFTKEFRASSTRSIASSRATGSGSGAPWDSARCRPTRRSTMGFPARWFARRASRSTCEGTFRTSTTRRTTSTCPSARTATCTTDFSCA